MSDDELRAKLAKAIDDEWDRRDEAGEIPDDEWEDED